MAMMLRLLVYIVLVFSLISGESGEISAAEAKYVDIPVPASFQPAMNKAGIPKYVSAADIERDIRKESPDLKKFYYNRKISRFIVPESSWMIDLLGSYDKLLTGSGVKAKADTWDCENFSGLLNSLITVRIWNAGYLDTRAAVGWLRVDAKNSWAGIPGNYLHALIFAVVEEGLFIIEPQNGQYIALKDYPNREYIQEVFLF